MRANQDPRNECIEPPEVMMTGVGPCPALPIGARKADWRARAEEPLRLGSHMCTMEAV